MSALRLAVHRAAMSYPGGIKDLAAAMSSPDVKVNPQILRNQLIGNERHDVSIGRVEQIIELCDSDELAHATAEQRHGVFIKLPNADEPVSDLAVLELVTHVWRANGDVGRAVDDTLADKRVERHEVAKVRKAIYKTQLALASMLDRLESMAEK